jgi:hypothetical protein
VEKKWRHDTKERGAAAARLVQANHDNESLAKELDAIRKIEVGDELARHRENPQKEHPSAPTYSLDEREKARQARMERFLILADEAPKPRGQVPQPQPLHQVLPSPTPSSEDPSEEED